jgi:hypothetical protein
MRSREALTIRIVEVGLCWSSLGAGAVRAPRVIGLEGLHCFPHTRLDRSLDGLLQTRIQGWLGRLGRDLGPELLDLLAAVARGGGFRLIVGLRSRRIVLDARAGRRIPPHAGWPRSARDGVELELAGGSVVGVKDLVSGSKDG